MGTLKGLLARAEAEVGYIEKASASLLDSETENRGTKNFTKYSRDINELGLMGCQGQPWCITYQFWLEVQEFGLNKALKHWNMTKKNYVGYNCFDTYRVFKEAGKVSNKPQLGAVVIFTTSHAARVTWISKDGKTFGTNEGNTSAKKYDRNGGMVAEKSYRVSDSKIKGFCIIDYTGTKKSSGTAVKVEEKGDLEFMRDLVKGDNDFGEIATLQRCLKSMGYYKGNVDRSFGEKTEEAVKAFQEKKGIQVNYPGTVGQKTWKVLLTEC